MDQELTGDTEFRELLNRLRAGDEDAASELIERFGDCVRREIRFRLRDSRLFRVVGESDLFQSAVSRFLWGLKLGQFDLDKPEELIGLLRTIAERRVCAATRFWLELPAAAILPGAAGHWLPARWSPAGWRRPIPAGLLLR
jgi:hypothetical protein